MEEKMAFIFQNPNPLYVLVGDCVIRAIAIATDREWDDVYLDLIYQGFQMKDMPSSNAVWEAFLRKHKFKKYLIPNTCPDCYKISDFCRDNPKGTFLASTGTHLVAVKNGNWLDTWNSGSELMTSFWRKEEVNVK
jgi:hypothetical protein